MGVYSPSLIQVVIAFFAEIDLNTIRAEMARSLETSEYTSIQERINPRFNLEQAIQRQIQQGELLNFKASLKPLLQFEERETNQNLTGIQYSFKDYLELVDWTGRVIRNDKPGHIDPNVPPILERLHIPPDQWCINASRFEQIHAQRFNRITPSIQSG